MAQALSAIGCPEKKIRVVPIGVDINKISAAVVDKNRSVMKVMFVGLEREKKGRFNAAEAYARVARKNKNLELHVIGDGPYCTPVKKLLSGAGVLDRCVFHGYISLESYLRGPRTHGHCHGAFRDHGKRRIPRGARRWW